MKKLSMIITVTALLFSMLTPTACAADTTDDMQYTATKSTITVNGLSGKNTMIVALYSERILSAVHIYSGGDSITANYAEDMSKEYKNADTVCVFLWDSLENLKLKYNNLHLKISELSNEDENRMNIQIGDRTLTATLADNSSAVALKELLAKDDLTINMSDYGNFEKVGSLGTSLPTNDEHIVTEAGDIILYQGNSLVIYYDTNTWNFTRIGKINDITQSELKALLGEGNVTVTISINK